MHFHLQHHSIFVLTGAGISKNSGLQTFRDQNGLWNNYKIEEVATPEAFRKNPKLVHDFYNLRRKELLDENVYPNPAHQALARLQHQFRGNVTLVTQNVDNLHERAGSENVVHMHGELLKIRCNHCQSIFFNDKDIDPSTECPSCHTKSTLRPDIVWFGESPMNMEMILKNLHNCDLFISIGTSGSVYPAANFVRECIDAQKIEINLEPSVNSRLFHYSILGDASIEVPKLVDQILDHSI